MDKPCCDAGRCDTSHHPHTCMCWRKCSRTHRVVTMLSDQSTRNIFQWGMSLNRVESVAFAKVVKGL